MQGALATGLAATAVNTKDDGFAQLKTDRFLLGIYAKLSIIMGGFSTNGRIYFVA